MSKDLVEPNSYEFYINAKKQLDVLAIKKNYSDGYQSALNTALRSCIQDFNHLFGSPLSFYLNSFEENEKVFLSYIEEQHKEKSLHTFRNKKIVYEILVNDVFIRYGTKSWDSIDSTFDYSLSPQERFIFCLNRIADIYYVNCGDAKKHVARIISSVLKKQSPSYYPKESAIVHNLNGRCLPIFIYDIHYKDNGNRTQKYKPYSYLLAVEKVAIVPKGYLSSVIKPITIYDYSKNTETNEPDDKNDLKPLAFHLVTQDLKQELYDLCLFKTEKFNLNKKRFSSWKIYDDLDFRPDLGHSSVLNARKVTDLYRFKVGKKVPSFAIFVQNIICLIKANQELNLIPNDKLNLFNLCNPDFMASYFTWLYEKRGYFLVTEVNAVSKTKAMWNPEGSFFYENSSFYCEQLNISKDELLEICKTNFEKFRELSHKVKADSTTLSKGKQKKIKVLDLDRPIDYIYDLVNLAKEDLSPRLILETPLKMDVILLRDIILTLCMSEVPLRIKNWANMIIAEDGYDISHECIYKDKNTKLWGIYIPKNSFKNSNQSCIPKDGFNYIFDEDLSVLIDKYIEWRRFLVREDYGYKYNFLFLSMFGQKLTPKGLGVTFIRFTNRYGNKDIVEQVNAHFMRDVVATTYLKVRLGAFSHAALLLLDSEETVKRHYGHLAPKDAFNDYRKLRHEMLAKQVEAL